MRREDVVHQIQCLFEEACAQLFESLNCDVAEIEEANVILGDAPIACVDAGSEEIEFLIAMQLPLSVLAMTYPVIEGVALVREDRLEDWISELSNQLIGRLKRKLIAHDCFVELGLPTTYYGADLEGLLQDNSERLTYFFGIDGESCACTIALEVFNEATNYILDANDHEDEQNEGELELF